MEIIVGTAGHIDHGKTSLIRALTGTDADRLPEEKQRGITIDLGFAELQVGETHFGFVDVPGHERFIKNMLAGASGIDIVLLVIAADEGVMPQTREHFEICQLLGLKQGIVALTKSDLVDDETLELARMDAKELVGNSFLENAPVIPISASTGQGIQELKDALVAVASSVSKRGNEKIAFLPIDRSFTVKGFGAVVTGTLASGSISEGDEIELLPNVKRLRVRNVQTHGRTVKAAHSGQRTAVNLAGIEHSSITRGMLLAQPDVLAPFHVLDASVEVLKSSSRPLKTRQRVRVHIGTAEILARVFVLNESGAIEPGERGFVQLRFESSAACMSLERFILRSYSPQQTIGGGQVVLPIAEKHRRKDIEKAVKLLADLMSASADHPKFVRSLVVSAARSGLTTARLRSQTGWTNSVTEIAILAAVSSGEILNVSDLMIDAALIAELKVSIIAELKAFHQKEPLATGITREQLSDRIFRLTPQAVMTFVIQQMVSEGKIVAEKDLIRSAGHTSEILPEELEFVDKLLATLKAARFEPPKIEEAIKASLGTINTQNARKLVHLKSKFGEIVKVTDEFYFAAESIEALAVAIRNYADGTADRLVDVAKFKEIAGVSRKYAIPLLEYFDREKVTVRTGNKRLVLK